MANKTTIIIVLFIMFPVARMAKQPIKPEVMDVGIVVDSSSSVRSHNYREVKNFLVKLVDKMHISHGKTHVGIIHFNHKAYLDWDFSSDWAQNATNLKAAIKQLKYLPGGTRTDRALEKAKAEMFEQDHGMRPGVPHVLLVITDGKTSSRSKPYEEVLEPLKKDKVKIIAIGIGPYVDNEEMTKIAMGVADNVVYVKKFDQLVSKIQNIVSILKNLAQRSCLGNVTDRKAMQVF